MVVAGIVWMEAAALIVLAILDLSDVNSDRVAVGLGGSVLLLGFGALLALAAWKFLYWHEWTRGLIVCGQLVALGLAWNLRGSEPDWLAGTVAIAAVAVIACTVSGPITRAFRSDESV